MPKVLLNRRVQFGLGVIALFVLGLVVGLLVSGDSSVLGQPDRVVLRSATGGFLESIPLTATEAVKAGWKDPNMCVTLKGRYFQKESGGEPVPYLLIYKASDELLATYFFSETDMPPPWKYMPEGLEGVGYMNFPHWGLSVYVRDSSSPAPCGTRRSSGA